MLETARGEKAEKGSAVLPTRDQFLQMVTAIRTYNVATCRAAADHVQFIAFCGARETEAANGLWSDIDFHRGTVHLRVIKTENPGTSP
ncbi:hypothetical protein DB346_24505 [Verrucomicrobia bacterium LW23]|nr:hypothetical protein DB346_24505 [Verrucomicrobia bacterium LW23]